MRILLVVITAFVMCGAGSALACTCVGKPMTEHFLDSDLVFEGRVLSSDIFEEDRIVSTPGTASYSITAPQSTMKTVFEVVRPLKGRAAETRTIIHSRPTGGNCGIGFAKDVEYRVFAYRSGELFSTSGCSYTHQMAPDEDFSELKSQVFNEIVDGAGKKEERVKALARYLSLSSYGNEYDDDAYFFDGYARTVERAINRETVDYFFYAADDIEKWNDFENLADAYIRVSELAPEEAIYRVGAGKAFLSLAKYADARAQFAIALELDPNNLTARKGFAKAELVLSKTVDREVSDYRDMTVEALDLSGKRAGVVDMSGSNFGTLMLEDANISHLRLVRANIYGGSFKGASLKGARLDAAEISKDVQLAEAEFTGASFIGGEFLAVNFAGANLTGADGRRGIFERGDFSGAKFNQADFSGASLSGANFENAVFGNVTFNNARLGQSNLSGTDLRRISMEDAFIAGAKVNCQTKLPHEIDVYDRQLIPIEPKCGRREQVRDFSGKSWKNADFSGIDLNAANFSQADFGSAYFRSAQLNKADFSGASGNAAFYGADLTGASFVNAKLRAVFHAGSHWSDSENTLPSAILDRTDFSGAELATSMFIGDEYDMAEGPDLSTAVFEQANLQCHNKFLIDDINSYKREGYKQYWYDKMSSEEKMYSEEFEKRRYDIAIRWVAAEGAFVRRLKGMWPSLRLDEECEVYFNELSEAAN